MCGWCVCLRYYLKQNRKSELSNADLSGVKPVKKRDYGINAVISFCVRKIIKPSLRTGFGDKKLYVVPKVLRKRQNKTYNEKIFCFQEEYGRFSCQDQAGVLSVFLYSRCGSIVVGRSRTVRQNHNGTDSRLQEKQANTGAAGRS